MTIEEIINNLESKKSADRRRAAKEIGKRKHIDLADDLYRAYLTELKDARTWETQVEMILALGLLDHKSALREIEPVVRINKPNDMVTYAAAQTFVRLKRQSLNDAAPSLELLQFGGLSTVDGCLNPLGYDKMHPVESQIRELIKLSWDMHRHKDRVGHEGGYCDPRYGLAAACAGWDIELTKPFLEHCISTGDTPVKHVAENSLIGKYIKLR
jgi:hypothetical protein